VWFSELLSAGPICRFQPFVRARRPAFGLIGIRVVIIGIRLQTWMRVMVGVDVYVRLSLEI
jgi:hypothetical protein